MVLAFAALTAATFMLAASGRNGNPLPPPGGTPTPIVSAPPGPTAPGEPPPNSPLSQQTAQKNGFDFFGNAVAPPGQKRSFPLDPLLQ
jgi:hypothetical protein